MERSNNNNGGCCFERRRPRYGGGGGQAGSTGQRQAAWQEMGRIMLRFRPIAPKPAAMAAAAPVPAATPAAKGRKRKAAAAGKRGRKPKKAASVAAPATTQMVEKERDKPSPSPSSSSSGMTSVDSSPPPATTLPLMPVDVAVAAPVPDLGAAAQAAVAPRASWVTVEDVTGTWRGGEGPPSPAAAGVLVDGVAPAFVSDRWGRVTWANAAFSRAASAGAGDEDDYDAPAMVVLGAKEGAAVPAWGTCAGFACRVRVVRRRGGASSSSSLVAPCDVWRLDAAAGYLWRLDLQATLSLSLGGLL